MARLWRVQERSTFAALRRDGVRRRVGPLTITHLDAPATPAVAFAIPKKVGTAVVRNRLRRRLRAAITTIDGATGTYLISASPAAAELSYQDLHRLVTQAVA